MPVEPVIAHSSPKRRRRGAWALTGVVAVLLVMAWLSATMTTTAVVATSGDVRSSMSDRVDALVTDRMAAHGVPGAAVAVVKGGQVVHLAGYGFADEAGRRTTADTPFLIASVSKPFTATALLGLVQEGRLSLDEPVAPYLADIVSDVPAGFEKVTVEHLLTHTSGLGMTVGTAGNERVHRGPYALKRRVADILARPLASEPGERFSYSNGGYTLLAAVIEQVTGTSFAGHMDTYVFRPLGMTRSFASDRHPVADDLATGHSRWFGRWRPRTLPYDPAGASMGYMGSTARDLTRFMQGHLGTGRQSVVSPEVRDLAHRPMPGNGTTGFGDPMQRTYGRGWFVGDLAGHPTVSHSGELGHFTTHVNLVPGEDRLGVAVLTNASAPFAGQGGNFNLSRDLTRMLLGAGIEASDDAVVPSVVLPVTVWAAALFILIAAARHVTVTLPRRRAADRRRWVRSVVLPAFAYIGAGTALLLAAPLGLIRHMVPDVGWGLTVIAYLAVVWGIARTALEVAVAPASKESPVPPPTTPTDRSLQHSRSAS